MLHNQIRALKKGRKNGRLGLCRQFKNCTSSHDNALVMPQKEASDLGPIHEGPFLAPLWSMCHWTAISPVVYLLFAIPLLFQYIYHLPPHHPLRLHPFRLFKPLSPPPRPSSRLLLDCSPFLPNSLISNSSGYSSSPSSTPGAVA